MRYFVLSNAIKIDGLLVLDFSCFASSPLASSPIYIGAFAHGFGADQFFASSDSEKLIKKQLNPLSRCAPTMIIITLVCSDSDHNHRPIDYPWMGVGGVEGFAKFTSIIALVDVMIS